MSNAQPSMSISKIDEIIDNLNKNRMEIAMESQKTVAQGGPQKKKLVPQSRPPIRQTLTSMYRMAKANPLLWLGESSRNESLQNLKLPKSVTSFASANGTGVEANGGGDDVRKPQPTKPKNPPAYLHRKTTNAQVEKRIVEPAKAQKPPSGKVVQDREVFRRPLAQAKKNFVLSNKQNAFNRADKQRVSLTAQFRKRQQMKCDLTLNKCQTNNVTQRRRSKSAETFRPIQPENVCQSVQSVEDITESTLFDSKANVRKVTFKSPVGYNRRSVAFTTPRNNHPVNFYSSTPRHVQNDLDLRKKLDDWLRKRGKSFSSFHHLKCFNVVSEMDDEDKENVELPLDLRRDESYENLKIEAEDEGRDAPAKNEVTDLRSIIKDALQDLLKLIQDGYSQDQCEAWLGKIRQKYHDLDEEPLYWECRAAVEQSKGNITAAVECYRSAIVKGAEVQTVDESLEQLLEKFSLFNINIEEANEESQRKARIALDARNAFKSTIIRFAVQEKKMKKKDDDVKKQYVVVTPVRRSARLSTPGRPGGSALKLCSTLKELDGDNVRFKNNSFLSARYAPPN